MTAVVVRDRRKGILLLAEALFDLLHLPETSTGAMLRRQVVRGEVADEFEPCHRCGGTWREGSMTGIRYGVNAGAGLVKGRYWRRRACPGDGRRDQAGELVPCPGVCATCGDPCEDCGGWVDVGPGVGPEPVKHRGSGLIAIDSHIDMKHRRELGSDQAGTKRGRIETWVCNFCHGRGVERGVIKQDAAACPVCGGSGEREHSPFILHISEPGQGDPLLIVEEAISRRDEEGSFHELELCLGVLRRRAPYRQRIFWAVHVAGSRDVGTLDEREASWLEEATLDLLAMMPTEVRVPWALLHAEKARREHLRTVRSRGMDARAVGQRNEEIRRRFSTGEQTLPALIAETGLSRSTVYEIVYGQPA